MSGKTTKTRRAYAPEFKKQAIELAKELGSRKAAEKLGIKNFQTLAAWISYDKKILENVEFRTMEKLRIENKRLKKEGLSEFKYKNLAQKGVFFLGTSIHSILHKFYSLSAQGFGQGLARACLARPIHALKLPRRGQSRVKSAAGRQECSGGP